ncbi:MAG: hypothetical protein GX558_01350 [Clostridiales bacterium]|nr:hypothetical protein [Clostridiales bacterium]
MPNTKITKKALGVHLHYGKWVYIGLAVGLFMLGDLLFTTTAYRAPDERKVDIELVSGYSNPDALAELTAQLLLEGQAYETARDADAYAAAAAAAEPGVTHPPYEPPLQEVNVYALNLTGGSDDVYGWQKFTVMIAANEGDIYFVDKAVLDYMVTGGVALPLDDYIASGLIDPGDRDLAAVTFDEPVDEDQPATGVKHIYALQADPLYGLLGDGANVIYDSRDKYMLITSYSGNPDTSAVVLNSMMQKLQTERPEWLDQAPAEPVATPEPAQ